MVQGIALTEQDLEGIPAPSRVQREMARPRRHRAAGTDDLPDEHVEAAADVLTALDLPILLKTHIFSAEPFQWKGGLLAHLRKPAHPASKAEGWRAILITDATGQNKGASPGPPGPHSSF